MPDTHAKYFSASASHRWLHCPGSIKAVKDFPDVESEYAAEGTLAHEYGELKLRLYFEGLPTAEFKKSEAAIKKNPLYKGEMDDCADTYAQHVIETANAYAERPFVAIEQAVDYSAFLPPGYNPEAMEPDGFGTADCILLTQQSMDVIDYKHGKGVAVSAENNSQLKLYALGALHIFGLLYPTIDKVTLHIVQPRNGGTSVWSTTVSELLDWAQTVVLPTAKEALSDKAAFAAGDWCRFCKLKSTCSARARSYIHISGFPNYGQSGAEMTPEQVSEALRQGEGIVEWLNDVKAFAVSALLDGQNIPGYKVVEGKRSRSWADQKSAFAQLRKAGFKTADMFRKSPLSPAQIEEAFGKKIVAETIAPYIHSTPGKPTLAEETDRRNNYSRADNDFADIPAITPDKGE